MLAEVPTPVLLDVRRLVAAGDLAGARDRLTAKSVVLRSGTKRARTLPPLQHKAAASLGTLAARLRRAKLAMPTFVDAGVAAMAAGYVAAYRQGWTDSGLDGEPEDAADVSQTAAEGQRHYLALLAGVVLADRLSSAALSARLDTYAASLGVMYGRGFDSGATTQGATTVTWHSEGDADVCEPCASRDGQTWSVGGGYPIPGEGNFGSDICEGGPRCRCELLYSTE